MDQSQTIPGWGYKALAFSWAIIQTIHDAAHFTWGQAIHANSFQNIVANQTIRVFIKAALP